MSQDEQLTPDPAWVSASDQEDTEVEQPASVPPATSFVHTLEELRAARSDGEDEDEPDFTFSELQEALGDESHPRHDEAVKANRAMAERLRPRLLALNESVLRQIMPSMDLMRGLRLSSSILSDTSALSAVSAAATAAAVPKIEIPKVNLPKAPTVPSYSIPEPPEIDYEGIEEAARLRADREAQQDEQAALSLEVQQSMAAQLELLGQRMEGVEGEIRNGNSSSGKVAGWTLLVAVFTLLATVVLGWVGLVK
ncbi:hypothetical protein ACIA0Z_07860 [Micrococcus luteus]|uniref:hypothetical protein n=1 Tax=Micrococcus luteus TaxID=1270 RepID=UPI0035E3211F